MRFTATVKKHEVVIRDIPLQDGDIVDVAIFRRGEVYIMTEEEEREVELGEAELAAGLERPVHEFLAELGARDALRGKPRAPRGARRGTRKRAVGAAGARTKPAPQRHRSAK